MDVVPFVLAGLAGGVVTGLTGANGMAVLLSVLLLAGVDVHAVIGVTLVTQVFTQATAFVPQARASAVSWRLVPVLALPAIPGSWLGASTSLSLPEQVLEATVAMAMLFIGVMLLRDRGERPASERRGLSPARLVAVGLTGAGSGFLSGLFGGGGNVVVANVLDRVMGVPFRQAVAMALGLGVVTSLTGAWSYGRAGQVPLEMAPWLVVPAIAFALVSSSLATRVPSARVRQLQGVYLLGVGLLLVGRLWLVGVA